MSILDSKLDTVGFYIKHIRSVWDRHFAVIFVPENYRIIRYHVSQRRSYFGRHMSLKLPTHTDTKVVVSVVTNSLVIDIKNSID